MSTLKLAVPRPVTEIFTESLNLSSKQRTVMDTLAAFKDGAKASEIAQELGMHLNTARGHLDELVARRAIFTITAPACGRGRPSLIYKVRIPDNRTVAKEYLTLIDVMSKFLGADGDEYASEVAREIGREWGEQLIAEGFTSESLDEALDSLCNHLRDMGFDPEVIQHDRETSKYEVCMRSCPFVNSKGELPSFVCDMHQGMLEHHKGRSPLHIELEPLKENGTCMISLAE